MGVFYEEIPKFMFEWILEQKVFWIATAPLSSAGHVNISPKGGEYFGVLDEKTFWYMDLTGSGSETISHLYEPGNGRITVQFNAFVGPPRILRLYGHGRVLENETKEFDDFVRDHKVTTIPGSRSIIIVDIHQVGSSCGFSVPYYDFKEHRPILNDHFQKKADKFAAGNEKESMPRYWAFKNAWSVDALPSMKLGMKTGQIHNIKPLKKMVGPSAPKSYQSPQAGFTLQQVLLAAFVSALLAILLTLHGKDSLNTLRDGLASDTRHKIVSLPFLSR